MIKQDIHIVGGGIIGLCSAWYLVQEGFQVTILDKHTFSNGTSYGNAGMIVPSHFVPLAAPGVITQGLQWLLDSKSPFYIKPRLNLDLLHWIWHFYRSANTRKAKEAMPVLYAFNEWSKELYRSMINENAFEVDYGEKGLLMLYRTAKQATKEKKFAAQARQLGLEAEILDLQGLRELDPGMDFHASGGLYFPGDAHLSPHRLMNQMITALKKRGVRFIPVTEIVDFEIEDSKIMRLIQSDGKMVSVNQVVVSAGSWTGPLLRKAGLRIHLQDGKGYSITFKNNGTYPKVPTILSEAKVALTPMGADFRIGGTLELSGMDHRINSKRVQGILQSIPTYYRDFTLPPTTTFQVWQGYRPCTPDGLPYIGKVEKIRNLVIGVGHGMMGLSLGAATGRLICELMTEQSTSIDVRPFRLNRF